MTDMPSFPLNIYSLDQAGNLAAIDSRERGEKCSFNDGLRRATALYFPYAKTWSTLSSTQQQAIDAALSVLPAVHWIEPNIASDHLSWLRTRLSPFDRVICAAPQNDLPALVTLNQVAPPHTTHFARDVFIAGNVYA